MKKQNLFLIALVLAESTIAFSQNPSLGVRGGLNVANLSMNLPAYKPSDSNGPRTSFNAGIYGQYSLNEKMALQAELFYSGEGTHFTDPDTEWPTYIKLSYLNLPILFKYTIVKNFYAMAGPQISYLLAAHTQYPNGQVNNAIDQHKKLAIGFVPALGYDWKSFSINVRYNIGLSKIAKSLPYGGSARYIDDNVKSNVFSVVVSYKVFNLKQ